MDFRLASLDTPYNSVRHEVTMMAISLTASQLHYCVVSFRLSVINSVPVQTRSLGDHGCFTCSYSFFENFIHIYSLLISQQTPSLPFNCSQNSQYELLSLCLLFFYSFILSSIIRKEKACSISLLVLGGVQEPCKQRPEKLSHLGNVCLDQILS